MLAVSILPHEATPLPSSFTLENTILWNGLDKFKTHNLLTW